MVIRFSKYWVSGSWHEAPAGLKRPGVFVFERQSLLDPTAEQIAEYRLAKRVVESLDGHMNKQEHEIAGKAERISAQEVNSILRSVRRDNPKAKVISHWNGEGCYTMSVGMDMGICPKGKKGARGKKP